MTGLAGPVLRRLVALATAAIVVGLSAPRPVAAQTRPSSATATAEAAPLVIGETFTIQSRILHEVRRINVYVPPRPGGGDAPLPVLYMPDGGMGEDFLHVAGLIQVSVGNGTMRPFLLVGIENTARRRDLTGPTRVAEDRKIAPRVGGSAAFRAFLRRELMPRVRARYRTTREAAIVGESLAGLFVVETFFLEPALFDTYIALDPSLWWNGGELVRRAADRLRGKRPRAPRTLFLAASSQPEIAQLTGQLAAVLKRGAPRSVSWRYEPMPAEQHSTIYHPAALRAFRAVLAPRQARPAVEQGR
ncbi:MAG TPA: alpha/beta hydrolase-fold protein [Kofleriaceae bacterium]|nr:alpha/beta hydrolase-fold protein [Kofleriaceae bacterium]